MEAGDVALPAALGHQAPAGPQRGVQAREQKLVVGDPVKDRAREDRVDGLLQRELGEVGLEERRPVWQRDAGVLDHGRPTVHRDHVAVGQALEQHLGHPPRAAARVEHHLVAARAGRRSSTAMAISTWGSETRS